MNKQKKKKKDQKQEESWTNSGSSGAWLWVSSGEHKDLVDIKQAAEQELPLAIIDQDWEKPSRVALWHQGQHSVEAPNLPINHHFLNDFKSALIYFTRQVEC